LKLVVAATAPFGAAVLEGVAERHQIELVLTRPDRPRGRGRKLGPPPAKLAAERLGIPVAQPEELTEAPGSAPVVVVCGFGLFIPAGLLAERLWLNVHPSLLPRWRGAAPVERAILAGDDETGVTIHRTTAELDAGPIAAQRAFSIGPEDDAGAVYDRAAAVAVELLDEVLPQPAFTPQPAEGATYAEKITAADRELDWSRPVEEIVNRVRALSPHIGARGLVGGRVLTVWRARPAGPGSALVEGSVELVEVQPQGRRRMTGAEYLRGLRSQEKA
jgi:methionyl-tRNA formyltransferase